MAAFLYGTGARAGDCDEQGKPHGAQADLSLPERSLVAQSTPPEGEPTGNEGESDIPAADTQSGVGGSGDLDVIQEEEPQTGTGGSGEAGQQEDPCTPATGGSGAAPPPPDAASRTGTPQSDTYVGGSGASTDRPVAPQTQTPPPPPAPQPPPPVTTGPAYTATPTDEEKYEPKEETDMRGLTVTLGGGVEGFTQALAPALSPGPAVAVNATLRPTRVVGLELGYSGAVHEIKQEDNVNGADIVRNGGQAALTVGLTATPVQPYLLGGIGISNYNVRDENSARFRDDTVGNVPFAAGLRTHLGDFTADARVGYSFLFDQEFARNTPTTDVVGDELEFSESGLYNATLNFGVTF
ncbi:MAG TPA: hypothetical protein VFO83_07545 [Aggregicoccus sp.]|nr:hypothetical protein [Aggregicoccus sp.]